MIAQDTTHQFVLTLNSGEWEGTSFNQLNWTWREHLTGQLVDDVVVLTQEEKDLVEKLMNDTSVTVNVKYNSSDEWLAVLTSKLKVNFVEIVIPNMSKLK